CSILPSHLLELVLVLHGVEFEPEPGNFFTEHAVFVEEVPFLLTAEAEFAVQSFPPLQFPWIPANAMLLGY
ncbi:hypothetical protein, partial [Providencia stuartii]|uniref:hypothetical protein n=1 Tax=Providencia stuartii TaxID=588 RepID=UPI0013CFF86B